MTLTGCAVQVPAACRTRGGYNIIEEAAFGSHFFSESCFSFLYLFFPVLDLSVSPARFRLLDHLQPSLRRLDMSHLDSGQCIVQLLDHRSHLLHAARETDLSAMVYDLSYR